MGSCAELRTEAGPGQVTVGILRVGLGEAASRADDEGEEWDEEDADEDADEDKADSQEEDEEYWRELGGRHGFAPSEDGVRMGGPGGEIESELDRKEVELARREERIMVREFQRDLAFNLRKARAPPVFGHHAG